MKLTIIDAMIYLGIKSKNTFLKRNIPYTEDGRKKLYNIDHLEKAFADKKDLPRILPPENTEQNKKIEVLEGADIVALEFKISEHRQSFKQIRDKVKLIKADKYQHEIVSNLIESLIKSSIVEEYYFGQVQEMPENKDIFSMWKQSITLKLEILKKLGF